MDEPQVVKIIVVGESYAGKTSLLQQYCFNEFDHNHSATIGCDFTLKWITKNGTKLKLQIWDVAGQERFQNLSKMFIRQAKGCLIMCDITNKKSLEAALSWRNVVKDIADEVPIFLIQNKTDLLQGEREEYQTEEYLNQFAQQHNFTRSYQISVKLNDKVDLIFYELVESMIEKGVIKLEDSIIKSSFVIKNDNNDRNKAKKKECC
ncbi:unnamed protein product [Paramecium primaurelia]|uniref:Uncharacterized protein n=1 Tax=Paramecium primaurelia TaxID=5886 RepID=A0A8S1NRK4_PARPR|nr:unnamed protein product [Paramecium primaurelia]